MKRTRLIEMLNETLKILTQTHKIGYTIQQKPVNYEEYVINSFNFIKHPYLHHIKKSKK